jgi:hypothetical protein
VTSPPAPAPGADAPTPQSPNLPRLSPLAPPTTATSNAEAGSRQETHRDRTSRQFVFTLNRDKPGLIALTKHDRHQWIRNTDELPGKTEELQSFLAIHRPRQ